jgi:hypothetical protein
VLFVMSRISPVLGRPPKEGMKFGATSQLSHLWENDGFSQNASKGEKAAPQFCGATRDGLVCAVADSGRSTPSMGAHQPRGPSGLVLFRRDDVRWSLLMVKVDAWPRVTPEYDGRDPCGGSGLSWMRCPDAVRGSRRHRAESAGGADVVLAIGWPSATIAAVAERQERERAEPGAKKQAAKQTRSRIRRRSEGKADGQQQKRVLDAVWWIC